MRIEAPVFVVGTGRSGSSALHDLLARHPRAGWFSRTLEEDPARPARNRRVLRMASLPVLRRLAFRRYWPTEAYPFWRTLYPGFVEPFRDLRAEDVTDRVRRRIHGALGEVFVAARPRPLIKITGWPRVAFLEEVFPDARFVHLVRDGRAVANSLLSVPWWWGWRGPDGWRHGALPERYREEWERSDRSFVALAGLEWKVLMDAYEEARAGVDPQRWLAVRYEDLCADPVPTTRRIASFADLPWADGYADEVVAFGLRSQNDRWRQDLTGRQQDLLQACLEGHLERFGYGEAREGTLDPTGVLAGEGP